MIEKIVTTEPASTEIVIYLDGKERLKGIPDKCHFPGLESIPKVVKNSIDIPQNLPSREIDMIVTNAVKRGISPYVVDFSLIAQIDPDLIVGQSLCSACAHSLDSPLKGVEIFMPGKLKVSLVYSHSPTTYFGVAKSIFKLSKILGREEKGEIIQEEFSKMLGEIKGLGKGLKIAFIEWLDPIYFAGLWVSDLILRSGARPIIDGFGRIGKYDELLEFNPDILVIAPCAFSVERTMREIKVLTQRNKWGEIRAVSKGEVYVFDGTISSNPTHDLIKLGKFLLNVLSGQKVDNSVAQILE
ncbi:cobalamin-binding protein [Sulfolobales archaeon HS-7]|nr:cobalamin-binding protein [Sulfolobales archaeon HS-7]